MSLRLLRLLLDARRAKREGLAAIQHRQRTRLADLVAFARAHSPYFGHLYQDLPQRVEDPSVLPVTDKKTLMARFDDWVTDRDITLEKTRGFVDNLDLIGEPFLGRYTVATTSGTTGTRGIFLLDESNMAVTAVLYARMIGSWLDASDVFRIVASGGRVAMVMATGGHFASTVAAACLRRSPLGRRAVEVLSVQTPLPRLVESLNRFRPIIVASYASLGAMLASEQEAGQLHIDPVLVIVTAEGLPAGEYDRIARAFHAKVGNTYAATECLFISSSCNRGWLHVNSDWLILEPVDADYRPVPPGEPSHTVLLSNLANRVQPILRYDLGDSILVRPDPCPCGNPLPAIRVQGRAAEVLTFPTEAGRRVAIAPLAFGVIADRTPGVEQLQIVQVAPTRLRVRLRHTVGADPARVWEAVYREVERLVAEHGLDHVTIERAAEPPEQSPGGKYREVIPMSEPPTGDRGGRLE